jgi:hypothetical protein
MCEQIDEKIKRYRNILPSITDQRTVEGLRELIAILDAQKAALHPEQGAGPETGH